MRAADHPNPAVSFIRTMVVESTKIPEFGNVNMKNTSNFKFHSRCDLGRNGGGGRGLVADIFVSYAGSDGDWTFWIGQAGTSLDKPGHDDGGSKSQSAKTPTGS